MRDDVRASMREIEDMDTFDIIGELERRTHQEWSPRVGRINLAEILLGARHGELLPDEGWVTS